MGIVHVGFKLKIILNYISVLTTLMSMKWIRFLTYETIHKFTMLEDSNTIPIFPILALNMKKIVNTIEEYKACLEKLKCSHLEQLQENWSVITHVSSIPWELEELRWRREIRKLG